MTQELFSPRLFTAYRFAMQTHKEDQKQKRKGKDVPYIVHPMAVALILARAGVGVL
jgi:(p)ppGpp synthase/HD superfamily hydrolase